MEIKKSTLNAIHIIYVFGIFIVSAMAAYCGYMLGETKGWNKANTEIESALKDTLIKRHAQQLKDIENAVNETVASKHKEAKKSTQEDEYYQPDTFNIFKE